MLALHWVTRNKDIYVILHPEVSFNSKKIHSKLTADPFLKNFPLYGFCITCSCFGNNFKVRINNKIFYYSSNIVLVLLMATMEKAQIIANNTEWTNFTEPSTIALTIAFRWEGNSLASVFSTLAEVFLSRPHCIWGSFGDGTLTDKGTGEEVLTFIGFMGFATVPRLERNRFHALLFLDIPFCLWVVSGLFGGFDDGLACLDDFVAGLKKPDTYKEWTGSSGLATDLFDVCTELPEDLDRNLIGGTTELLDIGTEPVESVGIGLFWSWVFVDGLCKWVTRKWSSWSPFGDHLQYNIIIFIYTLNKKY